MYEVPLHILLRMLILYCEGVFGVPGKCRFYMCPKQFIMNDPRRARPSTGLPGYLADNRILTPGLYNETIPKAWQYMYF